MTRAKPSQRARAAGLLERAGIIGLVGAIRRRASGTLTVLAYHRILDVPDEDAFEFDIELVSASVDEFNQQIAYLKQHFHPMTFREVLDHVDGGSALPSGACVVTFDDGFADNFHHAFPVLKRWGVPASIFVSTGYLDSQETFWYDRLAHAVLITKAGHVRMPGAPEIVLGRGIRARRPVVKSLLRDLKAMHDHRRREAIAALHEQLLPGGPKAFRESAPMTWEMAAEMSRWGIEFGSHTVSHPVLSMLTHDALRSELRDSKLRIEQVLGKTIDVIAYPLGGADAFSPRVQEEVRAAGYQIGLSYIPGVENVKTWNPYAIRRLHVERYVDPSWFRAMLVAPRLFGQG